MSFCLEREGSACASRVRFYRISPSPETPSARIVPDTIGAVVIGGALRGGTQAVQLETARGGPVGQVAGGVAGTGSQATQQRLGRALDTRPTITVASGQLCQVLLIKPLTLPALWQ